MAERSLKQYHEDIMAYIEMEYTQQQMIRALQERYGIEVKRSTLSDYIKALSTEESNGAVPQAMQADATAAVMESAGVEIINRLAQLIEGVQQLKHEGDEQDLKVQETLERHTRQFEALYGTFRGAVLGKIWLRALVYTGVGWGVALAAAYGYFWGLPF